MRVLKILGLCLLFISMAYASNWDLPEETYEDWTREHEEELRVYEEARCDTYYVLIGDKLYMGAWIDGMWYEPAEIYQEVVDAFLGEKEYMIIEVVR